MFYELLGKETAMFNGPAHCEMIINNFWWNFYFFLHDNTILLRVAIVFFATFHFRYHGDFVVLIFTISFFSRNFDDNIIRFPSFFAFWIAVLPPFFSPPFFAPHLKTTQRGGARRNFGRQNLPDLKWTQIVLHRALWLVHFPPSCSGFWIARAFLFLLSFFLLERAWHVCIDAWPKCRSIAVADLGHSIIFFRVTSGINY